jgi:hypothetical protein
MVEFTRLPRSEFDDLNRAERAVAIEAGSQVRIRTAGGSSARRGAAGGERVGERAEGRSTGGEQPHAHHAADGRRRSGDGSGQAGGA